MTDLLDRIVEAIFYGILGFAIVAFCFGAYSKFFGPTSFAVTDSTPKEECRKSPWSVWGPCDETCPGLFAGGGEVSGVTITGSNLDGNTCEARPKTP